MKVTIRDSGDLKAVAKVLRQAANGKELRRELTRGLRDELRPVAQQVQAAYRSAPSRGRRGRSGPSLRSLLAKATRVEVRTTGRMAGARVRVDGRKLPGGMRSLPSMWEGPPRGKRWRHPVFGDRETWVAQESHPTFYRTVAPHEAGAEQRVIQIVQGVLNRIERAP